MMAVQPITRKEKFLAKAGGQSVEELKPITREEMFLSKIGGGGSDSNCVILVDLVGEGRVVTGSDTFEKLEDLIKNGNPVNVNLLHRSNSSGSSDIPFWCMVHNIDVISMSHDDQIYVGDNKYGIAAILRRDGEHSYYYD